MKREKLFCAVPGCPRYCLPRINETSRGPMVDKEVLCPEHWRLIPIQHRRVYRRARKASFENTTTAQIDRCTRLWEWLKRYAIERGLGI